MTKFTTFINYPIRWLDPDKAVKSPAKYRTNDRTPLRTRRHNKAVLYRRG